MTKTLNQTRPKFAQTILSWTTILLQNLIQISMRVSSPHIFDSVYPVFAGLFFAFLVLATRFSN